MFTSCLITQRCSPMIGRGSRMMRGGSTSSTTSTMNTTVLRILVTTAKTNTKANINIKAKPSFFPSSYSYSYSSSSSSSSLTRRMLSSNTKNKSTTTTSTTSTKTPPTTFLQRWMGPKEIPPRGTLRWYAEMTLLCTVFAITGSSTMVLVRPAVSQVLGLNGSIIDGPWSYRICSIVIMTPLYATMLVVVGTVFGRHFYFRHFAVKMFSRFGIPPELMDKTFHETAKNFRKY